MFFLVIFVIVVVIFFVIIRMLVIIIIIIPNARRFPDSYGENRTISRNRRTIIGRLIQCCLRTYRVPLPSPTDCSKLSSIRPARSRLAVSLTIFSRFWHQPLVTKPLF